MPYGDILVDLDEQWLRWWLGAWAAWWQQAITWTNVSSSKVIYGIHLRAISQEVLMNLICNITIMCCEIPLLKFQLHLPGANELRSWFPNWVFLHVPANFVAVY